MQRNILIFVCFYCILHLEVLAQCQYPNHKKEHEAMKTISLLEGKRFSAEDDLDKKDGYIYSIGICINADAELGGRYASAGVLQRTKQDPSKDPKIVGQITDTEVMAGTNWIALEYRSGDPYHSHCGNESRRGMIMITCKQGETEGDLRVIEENNDKTKNCFYLFELDHQVACQDSGVSTGLSVGSVVLIIFAVVVGIYMIGGFFYQRFVVGAKGFEQIPNFSFWQDFGNLQADGCNLICRCGEATSKSRQYRGIGDDQLQQDEEDEPNRDDNLLPM